MITTIVLVNAEPRLIPKAAAALAGIPGVTDVYSVSGEWDLVVIVKVKQYEDIAKIVTEQFPEVPGLVKTTTLTAFRAYSKADLEQAWDMGVD
jgi:DNA-binding Lrp family transcriptional regulator